MKTGILVLITAAILVLAYIRLAPSNAAFWHVDPLSAKKPNRPNAFILHPDHEKYPSPRFDMDAAALAARINDLILSAGNAKVLAGSAESGFVTYVIRTKIMGYPDYASIKFIDLPQGGATLVVFSRSRFGYSDRGVNRQRVLGWLKSL